MSTNERRQRPNRGPVKLSKLPSHGGRGSAPVRTPLLPPIRVLLRRAFVTLLFLILLTPLAIAGLAKAGVFTPFLQDRAVAALRSAVPDTLSLETGAASVEFEFPAQLAVRFDEVVLAARSDGARVATIGALSIGLRADPLVRVDPTITTVRVEDASIALPTPTNAPPNFKVANLDDAGARLFEAVDALLDVVGSRAPGLDASLRNVSITLPRHDSAAARTIDVNQARALFDDGLVLSGSITSSVFAGDEPLKFTANALVGVDGRLNSVTVSSPTVKVPAGGLLFAFSNTEADRNFSGQRPPFDASLSLELERAGEGSIVKKLELEPQTLAFKLTDGDEVPADFALILSHASGDQAISIEPSNVRLGRTSFVLSGGIRDAPNADDAFEIQLLANNGVLDPRDTPVSAMAFGSSVNLIFFPKSGVFDIPDWTLETAGGIFEASGQLDFGSSPPYTVLRITSDRMTTDALKQSWPAPVARGARRWFIENMAGGVARNIVFDVAEPLRRRVQGTSTRLRGDTSVSLDMEGVRFDIAGDIPPVRDAVGNLSFADGLTTVELVQGTVFMQGGQTADASQGTLTIQPRDAAGHINAQVQVNVSGDASALGRLISFRPIAAQRFYPFEPQDLSGTVAARVSMDFRLDDIGADGGPDWAVSMNVANAASEEPIEGRNLQGVNGTIDINRQRATLDIDASLDGLPAEIAMLIPFEGSTLASQRNIVMKLGDAERNRLAPGIDTILTGNTPLTIKRLEGDANRIEMDLRDATLSLPWIGWSKGKGVAASAAFDLMQEGGVTRLRNLTVEGEGMAARGAVRVTKAGLAALDFSGVRLNRFDNFDIAVRRDGQRYLIDVTGESIDARSIIRTVRAAMRKTGGGDTGTAATITVRVARALGFSDEVMRNVRAEILVGKAGVELASIEAITDNGLPVSVSMQGIGAARAISIEALDAGDLLRFVDLYGQVRGGIMNVDLKGTGSATATGVVQMTDFRVFNEPRLASLVNTQSSSAGSLRDAVKTDINTAEVRFDLAYADVTFGDRTLDLQRGVLRGPLVGLTMQGRAYDANNQMRITGTFLPAYGLNSLFADIPIVGALLGNGRDRGLIGVTFLLTGKADKPNITVNPLSVIAPGIFRSIFEFR